MPRIGPYTLHTVECGRFALDGGAMFGIIPKPLWSRRMPPDAQNRIPLLTRCLLIDGGDRLILVDNGIGDKFDARFREIYAVDEEAPDLDASLAAIGYSTGDITDVVLTHLHFDHCGGTTRRNGDGLELVFQNADFHVQEAHWRWARRPNAREKGSFLKENLDPLAESDRLNLIEGDVQLWPGIDVLTVNGHTEAMQLVRVSGPEGTLVFLADLLPTQHHLAPPWNMAYDVRPLETMREKLAFLEQADAGKWLVFFEHDPNVEIGSITRTERGYAVSDARHLVDA